MKNIQVRALCLLLLIFSAIGCKKEKKEDVLPPATQVGKGTFGCLVNGKVWLPKPSNFGPSLFATYLGDAIQIGADNGTAGIDLRIKNFSGAGTYTSDSNATITYTHESNEFQNGNCSIVITKFDLIAHIISGTFSCDVKNGSQENTKITEGRFDLIFH